MVNEGQKGVRKEQREPCSLCMVEILLSGDCVYMSWVLIEGTRNPVSVQSMHTHTHTCTNTKAGGIPLIASFSYFLFKKFLNFIIYF